MCVIIILVPVLRTATHASLEKKFCIASKLIFSSATSLHKFVGSTSTLVSSINSPSIALLATSPKKHSYKNHNNTYK